MEFIANNWLYIFFVGLMVFIMVKVGGCCGGHSHKTNSGSGHSHR